MSLDIGFTDDWADGTYHFRLGAKQLDELQDVTGIGAELLYYRLSTPIRHERDYRTKWVRATIRLALIGGGLDAVKAEKLMRTYFDDTPAAEHTRYAMAAVGAALFGVKAAVEGKADAAETNDPTTTAPDGSTSPHSTETSPQ